MIRIDRGPEPASLAPVRTAELLRVRPLVSAGTLNSGAIGQKYSIVKKTLWEQQEMKCCYCEARTECDYKDVEHFRPKAQADRLNGTVDPGYWWLAWTWENLLFSCEICNRSYKNDSFPLEAGSVALAPENPPPGQERATLIDPCAEEPIDLIEFRFNGIHWQPVGRNGNSRGQETVTRLGLDRPDLLTLYDAHVNDWVKPRTDAVHEAVGHRDASLLPKEWRRVLGLLSRRTPFAALSFDAIAHYVPEDVRTMWKLELPRPPR